MLSEPCTLKPNDILQLASFYSKAVRHHVLNLSADLAFLPNVTCVFKLWTLIAMSSSLSDSESYQDRLLNLNSDEEADIMKLFASDEESCSWFSAPCVPKGEKLINNKLMTLKS